MLGAGESGEGKKGAHSSTHPLADHEKLNAINDYPDVRRARKFLTNASSEPLRMAARSPAMRSW